VAGFSLRVEKSERLVILGPSGCGKTTLLRMLAGFIPPESGSILIDGQIVASDGIVRVEPEARGLGMVFQDLALWPHLTVRGNLELGLQARSVGRLEREERIRKILQQVEMGEYIDTRPAQLSGGQQQRLALARALALQPKALLMDEPLSNLDLLLNIRLRKEIVRLQTALDLTLFYITHDFEEALAVGTRIVIMREGRIESIGGEQEVRAYFERLTRLAQQAG
jgi:ABC-type sugar transport system ATPase subunit